MQEQLMNCSMACDEVSSQSDVIPLMENGTLPHAHLPLQGYIETNNNGHTVKKMMCTQDTGRLKKQHVRWRMPSDLCQPTN